MAGMRVLPTMLLLALAAGFASAQTGSGTIAGVVRNAASSSVIPGASIKIVSEDTGLTWSGIADRAGEYEVPFLAAGKYTVRAEQPGYAGAVFPGIEVTVRETVRVDFRLEASYDGDPPEAVEPRRTPDSSKTGTNLVREQFLDLPLATRDFASLQILFPRIVPASSVGQFSGRTLSEGFRIAGGTVYSPSFSVEQADNNRSYYYGNAISPSLEIVQGVRVSPAGATSEYGGGAQQVDLALRGGTDRFHGSLFEYLQHDMMNAGNALSGADPPHLRRSQFGAGFSGPLLNKRLFFFGIYEGIRERGGVVTSAQVASQEQRDGFFPLTGVDAVTIKDPLTGKAFPGNQIPADRFSPVARYFLDHVWPLPNAEGQVFRMSSTPYVDSDQFDLKLDYLPDHNQAAAVYISRRKLAFDNEVDQPLVSPRIDRFDNLLGSIRYTRFIRAGLANSLLLAARRDYNAALSYSDVTGGIDFAGLTGTTLGAPARPGYPLISISGRAFAGRTGQLNTPIEHSGNVFQVQDTLRWLKGRHHFAFGVEVKRFQNNEMEDGAGAGQMSFNGRYTGSALADFFLGLPNQITFTPAIGRLYLRNTLWSAYIQDTWRIRDRLTMSIGIRYEYDSWPTERYDRMATSLPQLGMNVIASSTNSQLPERVDPVALASYPAGTFLTAAQAGLPRSLRYPDRNNFAPHVGFAYRAARDTAVRAGYGIDYVKNTQAAFNDRSAGLGLPFRIERSIVNPNPLTFDLREPFAAYSPKIRNTIDSAWYVDPHFVLAYVQTWSLEIEQRLTPRSHMQIAYVGNRMVDGKQIWNWNQSAGWPNRNDRYAGYGNILAVTNGADSQYNSLEAQYSGQVRPDLFVRAQYTWSKALTNAAADGEAPSIWVHDPAMQWGRSRWDRAHVFTAAFSWRFPFGKGQKWLHSSSPIVQGIVGSWQASGIVKVLSGKALTITSSLARTNLSVQGFVPADRLADGRRDHPTRERWFDISAFGTPPANRPGNAGYGILDGPGILTEDLALYRSFPVRESVRVQLRLEAYNALNHRILGDPITDVDNRSFFGRVLTSSQSLHLQAALRIEF